MSTVFKHVPLNHLLRRFYRRIAGLVSAYLIVFGAVAYTQTGGRPTFTQDQTVVTMGLRANRGFAEISLIVGVVVLLAILIGRNLAHWAAILGGVGFMLAGGAMMALMRTDANVLGFGMANCVTSFAIGLVLFAAGMYIAVGTPDEARHRELERHSGYVPLVGTPVSAFATAAADSRSVVPRPRIAVDEPARSDATV